MTQCLRENPNKNLTSAPIKFGIKFGKSFGEKLRKFLQEKKYEIIFVDFLGRSRFGTI